MRRKSIRGVVRDSKRGMTPLKRKMHYHSPKARIRRTASKALGHPTSKQGWASAGRHYRRKYGCALYLISLIAFVIFIVSMLVL